MMMIHEDLLASPESLPACLKDTWRNARVFLPDWMVHCEGSNVLL